MTTIPSIEDREIRPCVWAAGLENRCCFFDSDGYCNIGCYEYIYQRKGTCIYNFTYAEMKELIRFSVGRWVLRIDEIKHIKGEE